MPVDFRKRTNPLKREGNWIYGARNSGKGSCEGCVHYSPYVYYDTGFIAEHCAMGWPWLAMDLTRPLTDRPTFTYSAFVDGSLRRLSVCPGFEDLGYRWVCYYHNQSANDHIKVRTWTSGQGRIWSAWHRLWVFQHKHGYVYCNGSPHWKGNHHEFQAWKEGPNPPKVSFPCKIQVSNYYTKRWTLPQGRM